MTRLGRTRGAVIVLPLLVGLLAALPGAATAQGIGGPGGPQWTLTEIAWPTNFNPGATTPEKNDTYVVAATSVGGEPVVSGPTAAEPGAQPIKIVAQLPPEASVVEPAKSEIRINSGKSGECEAVGQTVTCTVTAGKMVNPGEQLIARIVFDVAPTTSKVLEGTASVEGGNAAPRQARVETPVGAGQAAPGIVPGSFFSTVSSEQAGGHPNATAGFSLTTTRRTEANTAKPVEVVEPSSLKRVKVETPPGLIGSAKATPKCTYAQFSGGKCPPESQVGVETLILNTAGGAMTPGLAPLSLGGSLPLYNMTPPAGVPAEFAAKVLTVVIVLRPEIRTGGDYGLTINVGPNSQGGTVLASSTMFWGDPAKARGAESGMPFVYNPTSCLPNQKSLGSVGFYQTPETHLSEPPMEAAQAWTGCDAVPFAPSITARPTTTVSDSPTGLAVDLHIPQSQDAEALASADLRDAVVVLPDGVAINPSAANGLGACTPGQFGLTPVTGPVAIPTTPDPATCPDSAKIGTVEIDTPLLDHPVPGAVYVAQPGDNPFGSLLAIYVTAYDPLTGVVVKLAGKIEADPSTGRLTARFTENPQLPFEDFKLDFFGGPRAALTSPLACGTHPVAGTMAPWSGTAPQLVGDSFAIDAPATPGACPADEGAAPHVPAFEAGTTSTEAGSYAPFVLHLRRADGTQRLRALNAHLPKGLLAKLAGVPYCPDATIAAAGSRTGREEATTPSCPAASEVGKVAVAAGSGSQPFHLDTGRAYLAGPYKGAPLSLAIVTPALAGPYDLGTVVVRAALRVDPRTTEVSVVSDPIPTILQGIPLDLRGLSVTIDRPGFTLNPTTCEPSAIGGEAISPTGAVANLSSRFQVANCGSLAFKPKLKLALRGATGRTGHPALKATLTFPKKGKFANIRRAQVGLPHSLFLDQGNIGTVCNQAQLQSATCPKGSIYGRAKAWSPLLDRPLEGPVYLGVGYGHKLPDLVADLDGQIRILLNGKIDTTRQKGLRSTFEAVPDAPVSRFTLELKGGKKFGLIENSENLCRKTPKASVAFKAQNAKSLHARPKIGVRCGKKRTNHTKAGAKKR